MSGTFWMQMITAVIGSVAFAILFKVRLKFFAIIAVISAICFGTYYAFDSVLFTDSFISALVSAMAVAVASELFARISKAPALVFLLSGLISIVPGSFLYNTTKSLMTKDMGSFKYYGVETLKIALGVAGGILAVSVVFNVIDGIAQHLKKNSSKTEKSVDK